MINIYELFSGLLYWLMRYLGIQSVWGEIHGSLEGLEIKSVGERSKVSLDNPWGAARARAPQGRLCLIGPGVSCLS